MALLLILYTQRGLTFTVAIPRTFLRKTRYGAGESPPGDVTLVMEDSPNIRISLTLYKTTAAALYASEVFAAAVGIVGRNPATAPPQKVLATPMGPCR